MDTLTKIILPPQPHTSTTDQLQPQCCVEILCTFHCFLLTIVSVLNLQDKQIFIEILTFKGIVQHFELFVSEDHLRVAAATALLRWRGSASTKSQRLCDSGFLAQVWCFHGNDCCCATHQYQLLFLEENSQVRPQASHLVWCLLRH